MNSLNPDTDKKGFGGYNVVTRTRGIAVLSKNGMTSRLHGPPFIVEGRFGGDVDFSGSLGVSHWNSLNALFGKGKLHGRNS